MTSVPSAGELIHLGMDTSVKEIVVAVLRPGQEIPAVDRIRNDEEPVRRLIGRFPDRRLLSACYEAGPGGYELHRLLTSMGVACDVVAPSLIPQGSSDRVKTDKRDSVRLALTHRAGLLTPVRVPSPAEEAVRDVPEPAGVDDAIDRRSHLAAAEPVNLAGEAQVRDDRHVAVERRVLRQVPDAATDLGGLLEDVEAAHAHGAGRGRKETGDHAQRGGLARAVRPEEAEDLSRSGRERDVLDRREVAVPFAQVRDFDHGRELDAATWPGIRARFLTPRVLMSRFGAMPRPRAVASRGRVRP